MNERKEEAINAVTEMYGLRDSLKTISRNLYDRCEEDYSQEINGIATLVLLTSVALEASVTNALEAIAAIDSKGMSTGAKKIYDALCEYDAKVKQEWFCITNEEFASRLGMSMGAFLSCKKELKEHADLVQMKYAKARRCSKVSCYRVLRNDAKADSNVREIYDKLNKELSKNIS